MRYENIELTGSLDISGSFIVPKGPNLPSVGKTGDLFFNTTDKRLHEYRVGDGWSDLATQTSFTSGLSLEYLVIAGGGGGGSYGGGGAGGYLSSSLLSIGTDSTITVTVGSGGAGSGNSYSTEGTSGVDSSIASATGTSFTTVTSIGGGGGGDNLDGADDGGSGGGGSDGPTDNTGGAGTVGQGNDGGDGTFSDPHYMGGGGGGAGTAGANATTSAAGDGGDGLASSITGTSTTRAGGGGGVRYNTSGTWGDGGTGGGGTGGTWGGSTTAISSNTVGTENTGGGGGAGKAGGSGVVILAYTTGSDDTSAQAAGGIKGDAGNGKQYHQFSTSGTLTIASRSELNIVTDSLEVHLDAGNFASRGTSTWTDLSGNARNFTANNGPVLGSNFYYDLDGSNDYFGDVSYQVNDYMTIMTWIKPDSLVSADGIVDINTSGNGGGFALGSRSNNNIGFTWKDDAYSSGGFPYLADSTNLVDSNWHCIAGVYNGNAYLYVDDMTTAAQSNTSRNSTLTQVSGQYIRIGLLGNQSSTYALEGGIGMVMIYSKGLTTTELLQNYNATKHNFI